MRWRRVLLGGCAVLAWSGCIAVTGLDQYALDDGVDASREANADVATAIDAPVARDARAEADADAGPDAPIDAGPCARCPRGTVRTLCVADACTETRRVFVTKQSYPPTFGSVEGGDTLCQNVASAANLGGQWKAWLSTPSSKPRERFVSAQVPYRLLDGTQVMASGELLLVDNEKLEIHHSIDIDETGAKLPKAEVWTGVGATNAKGTCKIWTSEAGAEQGVVGVTDAPDAGWASIYYQFCDRKDPHLYCFEQ